MNPVYRFISILLVLTFLPVCSSGNPDSLLSAYKQSVHDSIKFRHALNIFGYYIKNNNVGKSASFLDTLLFIGRRNNDEFKIMTALHKRAGYYNKLNKLDSAIYYYYATSSLADKLKDIPTLISCYIKLGTTCLKKSEYKKSLLFFQKAEKISELHNDTLGLISVIFNRGVVYYKINDYKNAKNSFRKVIHLSRNQNKMDVHISNSYNNLATIFLNEKPKKLDSAMYYYNLFLTKSKLLDHQAGIALAYYNIGEVYRNYNETKKAQTLYRMAENMFKQQYDTANLTKVYLGLGDISYAEKNYAEAVKNFRLALAFNSLMQDPELTADILKELSWVYYQSGKYKEAMNYYVKGARMSDSLYNENNSRILYEVQTKYETSEKEKKNQILQLQNNLSQNTIKQQKIINSFIIACLLLALLLSGFIFYGLKKQKTANKIISEQKIEVNRQKEIIEEKQKEILDSIHYAKRIQEALLANHEFIDKHFKECFIYFQPKDIVSGDFYWAAEKESYFYLAVCDSTGHGVPGAFMSLLNIGFLSEAIKEKNILEPSEIFNYVRVRLVESISQGNQKDGFDGIIIRFDKSSGEIIYCAANNAPILITNKEINALAYDKMPVGKGEKNMSFSQYSIQVNENTMLYLHTDGFPDQFGGPKGKKFKQKQLSQLLINTHHESCAYQLKTLDETFLNWKGNLEQVDDVCIVGIRLFPQKQ